MVTVTAETFLSSSVEDAWTALGRRATYLYFPGVTAGNGTPPGALHHELDLPIVDRQEQTTTLTVSRAGTIVCVVEMTAMSFAWRAGPSLS